MMIVFDLSNPLNANVNLFTERNHITILQHYVLSSFTAFHCVRFYLTIPLSILDHDNFFELELVKGKSHGNFF